MRARVLQFVVREMDNRRVYCLRMMLTGGTFWDDALSGSFIHDLGQSVNQNGRLEYEFVFFDKNAFLSRHAIHLVMRYGVHGKGLCRLQCDN